MLEPYWYCPYDSFHGLYIRQQWCTMVPQPLYKARRYISIVNYRVMILFGQGNTFQFALSWNHHYIGSLNQHRWASWVTLSATPWYVLTSYGVFLHNNVLLGCCKSTLDLKRCTAAWYTPTSGELSMLLDMMSPMKEPSRPNHLKNRMATRTHVQRPVSGLTQHKTLDTSGKSAVPSKTQLLRNSAPVQRPVSGPALDKTLDTPGPVPSKTQLLRNSAPVQRSVSGPALDKTLDTPAPGKRTVPSKTQPLRNRAPVQRSLTRSFKTRTSRRQHYRSRRRGFQTQIQWPPASSRREPSPHFTFQDVVFEDCICKTSITRRCCICAYIYAHFLYLCFQPRGWILRSSGKRWRTRAVWICGHIPYVVLMYGQLLMV